MKVSYDFCISKRCFSFILVNYISVLEKKDLRQEKENNEKLFYTSKIGENPNVNS